jgi:hypothetical protein
LKKMFLDFDFHRIWASNSYDYYNQNIFGSLGPKV